MTTIEERAQRICANTFCNQSHAPVCKTCAWRLNREPTEPQCRISEYKDVIKDIYESAICQLILQREELTRWHDPEKTSPNNLQRVLVKYKKDGGGMGITIATYHRPLCTGNGTFAFEVPPSQNIIGWRSIDE